MQTSFTKSIKEEIASVFGYTLTDNTTIRAMLSQMDTSGRLDQRALIEIIHLLVERVKSLERRMTSHGVLEELETEEDTPDESWLKKDIIAFAEDGGIEIDTNKTKPELIKAIKQAL